MFLFERWVPIHKSFGKPRIIYSIRHQLERHQIYTELKISHKTKIPSYQLLVPKRDAHRARYILKELRKKIP